jgi:transmembrane sensor
MAAGDAAGEEYWCGGTKRKELRLPDGTEVIMHAGTIIRLSRDFVKGKRELWVEGDVIFEVRNNAAKPLVLHTAFLRIEAPGARFRVDAKPREAGEEVDVLKGSLKVMKSYHSDTDNEPEHLSAGEMLMINRDIDLMEKEKMDGSELKDWDGERK